MKTATFFLFFMLAACGSESSVADSGGCTSGLCAELRASCGPAEANCRATADRGDECACADAIYCRESDRCAN